MLTYGLPDFFDSRQFMACKPLVVGEKIWVYYLGSNEPHAWNASDQYVQTHLPNYIPKEKQSWLRTRRVCVGLATLRRDGFVSLDAGPEKGQVITKPFLCRGEKLVLNANAAGGQAELRERDGSPLKGFTTADCDEISGDSLNHLVTWNGQSNLSSLKGTVIQLKLLITKAKLFSFCLKE